MLAAFYMSKNILFLCIDSSTGLWTSGSEINYSAIEPCADFILSVARRSILVGGGDAAPVQKYRRRRGLGGQKFLFYDFRKEIRSILKIIWWPFLVIERLKKIKIANMATQIIGGGCGAPITKSRGRRQQIVGGGRVARPAHGSTLQLISITPVA